MASVSLDWSSRPARELLHLAWPITVSTLSYSAMTLTGTMLVAHVGADELAGAGLAGTVAFALVCFGMGMLRGVKTVVAQAIGAGRGDRVDDYLGAGVWFAIALGAVATLLAWTVAPWVGKLCASPRAGGFAVEYLRLRTLGAPILLVYCALRETRYGESDAATPMRAALVGNVLNITLASIFVLGWKMGVSGAALATVAGEAAQCAVLAWPMRERLARVRWRPDAARVVWRQGMPTGLQFVMEVGSFLLLTAVVARMSSADGAAHQMVLQIVNVSFLPAHAIAEAASVLVGHAVGAGRYELVKKVAARAVALGVAYSALCLVVLAITGGAIVSAMSSGDVALASSATTLVHISLVFLVADAANVIARGILRGAGDVRFPAVIGVLTAWTFTPPLAWLLGVRGGLGAAGGWIGLAGEIIVGAAIFWLRVVRGSWRAAAELSREAVAHAPAEEVPCGLENADAEYVSRSRNTLETATPGPVG